MIELQTFYHASKFVFDFPDYNQIVKNNISGGNHENGCLGLWVANDSSWISGFGRNVYKVDVKDMHATDVSVSELSRYARDQYDYLMLRQSLVESGYNTIRIVENDGRSEMCVIIDFRCIFNFERIT